MRDEAMPGTHDSSGEDALRSAPPSLGRRAIADLPASEPPPGLPYDSDEAVALADEPTLYEEDEPGPHFIEVRIGEDEPETEGLPAREITRP